MAATSITLTDTGKRRVSDSAANESVKANSGSAVTLRVNSITYKVGVNLGDEAYKKYKSDTSTNEFDWPEVHKGSLNPAGWILKGILDMSLSADQTVMGNLVQMAKTKGYKELGTTNDANNTIMIRWSEETAVTSKDVRVKEINFRQVPRSSKVNWTLTLLETT